MSYLIDTNVIIGFMKNEPIIVNFIAKTEIINISTISVGEMYFGAFKSNNYKKNFNIYTNFFDLCNILIINENTAKSYAALKNELRIIGQPIPENDLWIAANALEHHLTIVTRDKHLLSIPSIQSINL